MELRGGGCPNLFLRLGPTSSHFSSVWVPKAAFQGWNGMERSCNKLLDVQVQVLGLVGSAGVPPILAQERPKRAQKWPKSNIEYSAGPKWLERRGTKLERVIGRPEWVFRTNFGCGGVPNFGTGAAKKSQKGQKLTFRTLVVQNGWNSVEQIELWDVQAGVFG